MGGGVARKGESAIDFFLGKGKVIVVLDCMVERSKKKWGCVKGKKEELGWWWNT